MTAQAIPLRHVGLIGFGSIGQELYGRLAATGGFRLTVLLRDAAGASAAMARDAGAAVVTSAEALAASAPDLVVEAAGRDAVTAHIPGLLERGIPVIIASTSALAEPEILAVLDASARQGATSLTIVSGAIGGLDYLAAVRHVEARIRYTSRKPPAAWAAELAGLGHDPAALGGEVILFEGTAAEAATLYPRNLNVGLTIALAAGPERTVVRVVADPAVTQNTHEIAVDSPLGHAEMRFANEASRQNPKSSAIVPFSLEAAVRRHFAYVVL
jgi:aspartate dehydrogenase